MTIHLNKKLGEKKLKFAPRNVLDTATSRVV